MIGPCRHRRCRETNPIGTSVTALLLVVLCLLCALDTGMSYAGCLFALAGVWFSALAREGLIALSVLPLPDDDRTETRS